MLALAAVTPLEIPGLLRLGDPVWLHAAWLAPAALLLAWLAAGARARTLARLGDPALVREITRAAPPLRRALRALCVALALASLALALARPQHGERTREVERRGRDIVFIVDVSRSMLARDLAPNRLERAKIWINDLIDVSAGDRVGLIAFAGVPVIKSPLTHDRAFFRLALELLGPDSAPRGGTLIGDAIRKALDEVFELRETEQPTELTRTRDIILITDGEDQESFPVRAAELAAERGVRIIAIGVGDSVRGTPVPAPDSGGYIEYGGEPVLSRLDADTLAEIAAAAPGNAYLEVGTGEIDLARVYRDLIASAGTGVLGAAVISEYGERFFVFLALALVLLAAEGLVGEGRPRE